MEVVNAQRGRARLVVENYGESELARRFGVTRYPAVFVDDVLIATPSDFGFYGKGESQKGGRYAPWVRNPENQARFKADLARMIELVAAGRKDLVREQAAGAGVEEAGPARLPELALTDLDGRALSSADLAGRVVLVEFWATWCPPCRGTLAWLGELQKQHGDRLVVLAVAVESEEAEVRAMVKELALPVRFVLGTPELAQAFGDISAVPSLFVFDKDGGGAARFLGAPPTLHAEAGRTLEGLLR